MGATLESYTYDIRGNMTSMPGMATLNWDFNDRFRSVDLGGGGVACYSYDASGNRTRKVIERRNGSLQQRLYLGALEIYTESQGNVTNLERETLHVMDNAGRLAMVDSRTAGDDGTPAQLIRYQFDNHLGSATLELDDGAKIISYEEYYPYGNTSFQSVDATREVPARRYRYTGKERDAESGLYYHGARYYAPWLARWTSVDHENRQHPSNAYVYTANNPIIFIDPDGRDEKQPRPGAYIMPPNQGNFGTIVHQIVLRVLAARFTRMGIPIWTRRLEASTELTTAPGGVKNSNKRRGRQN